MPMVDCTAPLQLGEEDQMVSEKELQQQNKEKVKQLVYGMASRQFE